MRCFRGGRAKVCELLQRCPSPDVYVCVCGVFFLLKVIPGVLAACEGTAGLLERNPCTRPPMGNNGNTSGK